MKLANHVVRPAALSLCLLLTAGCSLIDPYVAGDTSAYRKAPTLDNAVTYAEETRDAYRRAISVQTGFNTLTGVALVGTATAAAILGVTGASPESIVRLGISGAGLFAANRLLFNSPRQQIYNAGAKAITCGLGIFEPLRTVDSSKLDELVVKLSQELQDLRASLTEALNLFPDPQRRPDAVFVAQNVLAAAEATLERGRDVQRNLRQAGSRLYTFVHGVNDQVTSGLIRTETDLSQLINSLSTTIPINAALIAGLPTPGAEPPGIRAALGDAEARAVERLEEQTAQVKATADAIERLIVGIAAPDPAAIAACNDFLQLRPFRVFPQPTVVVDTSAAEATADVVVSGGTVPYQYAWLGQVPPPGVTLSEVPGGRPGAPQLAIRIKAPQNTSGTYQLLVEDNAGNSATLLISFVAAAAAATPTTATQPRPEADPKVAQIQEALVALGCLAPETVTGDSNTDGVWGDRTAAAYAQFAQDFLGGTEAAANTLGTLGSQTFRDNLIAALEDAKGGTQRCTSAAGST